jgi:hypothetical protein
MNRITLNSTAKPRDSLLKHAHNSRGSPDDRQAGWKTMSQLTPEQRSELDRLRKPFIAALLSSPIQFASDFRAQCCIVEYYGTFRVVGAGEAVDSICSKDRAIVQALFDEAATQLGR